MSANFDINDLAHQAKQGNALAFEKLARQLTPILIAFFRKKGGCDAEELTQQTWLQVIGGLSQYDPSRDFKSWLFSIAYYRWVDWGRANQRRRVCDRPAILRQRAEPDRADDHLPALLAGS